MEPTLVVCGSKVRALAQRLNTELAEHILGFAVANSIMHAAHPDAQPNACQRCRAAAIVDMSDARVWLALFCRFSCNRERKAELQRHLERGGLPRSGSKSTSGHFNISLPRCKTGAFLHLRS